MFNPAFVITNKILTNISKIEAAEEVIKHSPLLPLWEKQFKEEALIRSAYHGTHIEGNNLQKGDAKDILMGRDVIGRPRDIQEIINYRKVIEFIDDEANKKIDKISEQIIKKLHRILTDKILSSDGLGEYRTKQVIIRNSANGEITFRPPPPIEVPFLMREFVYWLNRDDKDKLHPVLKAGIAHHELVRIHPFLDGNGRVGRLLITLYLVANKLLAKPTLYLSDFLEKHRQLYYDNLTVVRTKNDLTQWIKFFLSAVIETAQNGIDTFQKILKLRNEIEDKRIVTLGRKLPMAKNVINYLYKNPLIQVSYVVDELKISKQTANTIINDFVRLGILKEVTGLKKNRMYLFEEYVELFKK